MRGLSNYFRSRDPTGTVVRPVGPGEIEPAVRLLLGTAGQPAESAAAVEFEAVAVKRGIDLLTVQAAFFNGQMLSAALPVDGGGRAVLLMMSPAGGSRLVAIASARCVEACVAAWPRPASLFQILLDPAEWRAAEELRTRGFDDLATLLYLQRTVPNELQKPDLPNGLTLLTDSPANRPLFKIAIEASYEHSLDCPRLHGKRSIDEVIAAHQATGEHDPALWFCLLRGGMPVGALLLSRIGDHAVELVYLGLAPAGRGQGLGDYLLKLALAHASLSTGRTLTLAVDDGNKPALNLYYRHGFSQVHSRLAMLCERPLAGLPAT